MQARLPHSEKPFWNFPPWRRALGLWFVGLWFAGLLLAASGLVSGFWRMTESRGYEQETSKRHHLAAGQMLSRAGPHGTDPYPGNHSPAMPVGPQRRVRMDQPGGQSPAWAIGFGKEFWRQPVRAAAGETKAGAVATQSTAAITVADVIERVSHALRATADGRGAILCAKTYVASFDENGMRFSPFWPAGNQAISPAQDGSKPAAVSAPSLVQKTFAGLPEPDPETEGVFRTLSVARDGRIFYSAGQSTPEWSVLGNTAQASLSPGYGVLEHCEARSAGIELAWVLSQSLPGDGSLIVDAELAGLKYAGQTERGQHFADAAGLARVCVGPVKVVDVSGRSWNVPTTADGNRLRVEVPAAALAQASYPLAIDPVISPEFGMDNPVIVPSAADQFAPRVAVIGANYLVVWADDRNGKEDIYGARVTGAGAISDPTGIAVSTAPGNQLSPAVAADGNNYVVVWEDHRNQAVSGADIYAARVTTNGMVLDSGGIPISTAANDQTTPAVAFNGTNYLVVWADSRALGANGSDIYAARLAPNGAVLDAGGISLSIATTFETSPGVAASGSSYLVVWQDSRNATTNGMDIYGTLVGNDGSVLNPNGIAISTATNDQVTPAVASISTNYLVVWADSRALGSNGSDIYAARLATNGVVLDVNGIALSTATTFETSPAVAANGSSYLVVWQDSRNSVSTGEDIYGTRVSAGGSVLNTGGIAISTATGDQVVPAVVPSGTNYLVVWQDGRGASENIYGARVTGAGAVADGAGFVISTGPNTQSTPAVAFNGTLFLVVWVDDRNSATTGLDIFGARVTTNGTVADINGIAISTAADTQYAPAVAANGTNFLVAWADFRNGTDFNIYGTRITGAGTVSDANGIAISTAPDDQIAPTVAANGSGYLVAWQDNRNLATTFTDIYGARVTTNGVVSDSNGIPICKAANVQASPKASSDGTNFLVVWSDFRNATLPPYADIYGARVTSAGVVADTNGIVICAATNDQASPAVAFNGINYLVVWQDNRAGAGYDIYGARVSTLGAVADTNGFAICTATNDQTAPAVTSNGGDFFVVWEDMRNANASGGDVYGARVSGGGSVLDSSGVPVNADSANEQNPAVAVGAPGQLLAVSQDSLLGADRALGNFVSTVAPPPVIQSLSLSNRVATIVWTAIPAQTYRVQYRQDLSAGTGWSDLTPDVVASAFTATNRDNTLGTAAQRFYRVVALP